MRSLHRFLGLPADDGKTDRRRKWALVALGALYLETGRYVEARLACSVALGDRTDRDPAWLQSAHLLEARVSIALGERAAALERLEMTVRTDPEGVPEMVVFLLDNLIDAGQHDRAIEVADLLAGRDDRWGDEVRYRRVKASFERAKSSNQLAEFPPRATEIAQQIGAAPIQAEVARILADAYEALGMDDRARSHRIRGAANKTELSRALFAASRYEDALRELEPIESTDDPRRQETFALAELFDLARCHEALHMYHTIAANRIVLFRAEFWTWFVTLLCWSAPYRRRRLYTAGNKKRDK